MQAYVIAALITAPLALVGVVAGVVNTWQIERMRTRIAAAKEADDRRQRVAIYSAPLSHATFDLQSRLYNFLHKGLASVYLTGADERSTSYVVDYTVYLIAQWFCWSELTRRHIHFIELETPEKTRHLLMLQDKVRTAWRTDRDGKDKLVLRIFSGEQRAMGEALIVGEDTSTRCMGFNTFLTTYPAGANELFDVLRDEVKSLSEKLEIARPRLTELQHLLIKILELFDAGCDRFPADGRQLA